MRTLLIIPTLGQRLEHLRETLTSIRAQEASADVVIVSPVTPDTVQISEEFRVKLLEDPGNQTQAINAGVRFALSSRSYDYVNWLNDDDFLKPGALAITEKALDANPHATVAYGACSYIDARGNELWVSKAGPWAQRILSWGPDLIPQPGMLIRMSAWQQVGGIDESYRFAFDLDLLLKLKKIGPLIDTGQTVSSFRWHADSLTVGDRTTNLVESERAKRASLSPTARKLAWTWEKPVRIATRVAAAEVSRRARKISS